MECYLYILQSISTHKFYIGISNNPEDRFTQHNSGKTLSTKNGSPWELVFLQKYDDKSQAMKIEYKLKKLKNRKIIQRIISDQKIKLIP